MRHAMKPDSLVQAQTLNFYNMIMYIIQLYFYIDVRGFCLYYGNM